MAEYLNTARRAFALYTEADEALQYALRADVGTDWAPAPPPDLRDVKARHSRESRELEKIATAEARQWSDAAESYRLAVEMMTRLAWPGVDRPTRERHLAHWRGLATASAACAVNAGQPDRAIDILENGRLVLWNHGLRLRTPTDELAALHPRLARRLHQIRRILDAPSR